MILEPQKIASELDERDIEVFTARGSGPGGQHRNTTESCVVMRHRPTGIEVRIDARSQHDSRRQARQILKARIAALRQSQLAGDRNASRRTQAGSGERGDKRRTYRVQDQIVIDHVSGRKCRLDRVLSGYLPDSESPRA